MNKREAASAAVNVAEDDVAIAAFELRVFRHRLSDSAQAENKECIIAYRAKLATRPAQEGQARTKPPTHAGLLAKALVTGAQGIARCFELVGEEAMREWVAAPRRSSP